MSAPNLDHLDSRWQALLEQAVVDLHPPDRFGMIGVWAEEDGWHFRPDDDHEVRLPMAAVEEVCSGVEQADVVYAHEAERAIVHTAGHAKLRDEEPGWSAARSEIVSRLSSGIGVVALGGVCSGAVDDEGFSAPLRLGKHAVAGHLDPSVDSVAADLARRHDLPGYRFSDDSWWTEDFLAAKEDPDFGVEQLEKLENLRSWPWLALLVATPASGAAAESAAIAAAQALLGALVLLDQPPGTFWSEPVPWIAGGLGPAGDPRWPGDESREFTLPIAPQHLDAMAQRLDNAESSLLGPPARIIDLAAHAEGPGGELVAAVIDSSLGFDDRSEALATGCRLVWFAAASDTADTRFSLASAAAKFFGERKEPSVLVERGRQWRLAHQKDWPGGQPFDPEPDIERWRAGVVEASDIFADDLATPSWGAQAAEQAATTLGMAQALFFGHAENVGDRGVAG